MFYAGSPKASTSTEEILADVHEELSENGILNGLRQFLASRSRAQMRLTISALSSADMLRFYVILNHICRRGLPERLTDVYSESMRRVALMINEIVRRLCWSMEDVVDHHSNVKTTWWLQHILQGCDRWLLPQERVSSVNPYCTCLIKLNIGSQAQSNTVCSKHTQRRGQRATLKPTE